MPGRKRLPGTDAQRAAARRLQVRQNVRAFRLRDREKQLFASGNSSPDNAQAESGQASSSGSGLEPVTLGNATQEEFTIQSPDYQACLIKHTINQEVWWSVGLPFKISFGPAAGNVFISADNSPGSMEATLLPVRVLSTLPNRSPVSSASGTTSPGGSPGLAKAATHIIVRNGDWTSTVDLHPTYLGISMLVESLLSTALYIISKKHSKPELRIQATQIHTQSLQSLREGFEAYNHGNKSPEQTSLLAATAMSCSLSEIIINKSWDKFCLHLRGVGALMENTGLAGLVTDTNKRNVFGYRKLQFYSSILERRRTFLARDEWIHFAWKKDIPILQEPIHTLIDIAIRLPSEMEDFDNSDARSRDVEELRFRLVRLKSLEKDLETWNDRLINEDYFSSKPPSWVDNLPFTPPTFNNPEDTHAFTTFTGVEISLLLLRRRILKTLSQSSEAKHDDELVVSQTIHWARLGLKCAENFLHENQPGGKLPLLFAFDQAWEALLELNGRNGVVLSEELEWCSNFVKELEGKGIPLLRRRDL